MAHPHDKAAIRAAAITRRDAMSAGDREAASHDIAERALASGVLTAVDGPVAVYWPMRSEVDTRPLITELALVGQVLALPAVITCPSAGGAHLVFRCWAPGDALTPGGFGTQVPGPRAAPCQPRVLIVPMVAFDRRCGRLGYGKGYYDRAIASLKQKGGVRTVGVAFTVQDAGEVPMEAHDQRLDVIVTERDTIRRGQE